MITGAGCILYVLDDDGQIGGFVLVLGKKHMKWSFPKGRMNRDTGSGRYESYDVCAIRETLEETGIVVTSIRRDMFVDIGKTRYYLVECADDPMRWDEREVSEARRVTIDDTVHIRRSLNRDTSIFIRMLQGVDVYQQSKRVRIVVSKHLRDSKIIRNEHLEPPQSVYQSSSDTNVHEERRFHRRVMEAKQNMDELCETVSWRRQFTSSTSPEQFSTGRSQDCRKL